MRCKNPVSRPLLTPEFSEKKALVMFGGGHFKQVAQSPERGWFWSGCCFWRLHLVLRFPAPPTEYKAPSEPHNTPQNTPQNTPRILSRNQNTKKIWKPYFRTIFAIFSYFGFGRGFGVYIGVYVGAQRGFVFCRGRRKSQISWFSFRVSMVLMVSLKRWILHHFERGWFSKMSSCRSRGFRGSRGFQCENEPPPS